MKKMKKMTKLFTILLVLSICVGLFASCNQEDPTTDVIDSQDEDQTIDPNSEEALNFPQAKKYNYEYKILTSSNGSESLPYYICEGDPQFGEVISNALYQRQLMMEEEYGVTLTLDVQTEYKDKLTTAASTGEYICDITMIPAVDTFALASQGAYVNLLGLSDSINLDASYWDQRIQSEYRINDMLFTLEGDHTYVDELRTLVVLYNQQVYQNYDYKTKYGTPYSMVENHTWTYATMMEMIKDLSFDSNSDETMNEYDTWGMVSELTGVYYFFLGSGLKTMENNNGELSLRLTDASQYQRIYDVLEETMKLSDNIDIMMPNRPGAVTTDTDMWTAASNVFEYDRALFRTTTLSAVSRLREMKSDYGILPIPAFYDDQTDYYCWVSGNTHCPLAISRFVKDITVTAEITERLAYHSRYGYKTLYSAFFDNMAYSRICKTEDDHNMLELVIDSKTFDIDQVTKITGVESTLYSMARDKTYTVLSSKLSSLVTRSDLMLNKYVLNMISKNS